MNLRNLIKLQKEFQKNSLIGFLNTKRLCSKTDDLRDICGKSPIDFLWFDEIELASSYPHLQLKILSYQCPLYKDQNKYGGGKIVFLREGLIAGRFRGFEGDTTEINSLEQNMCKKIWLLYFLVEPLSTIKNPYFSVKSQIL